MPSVRPSVKPDKPTLTYSAQHVFELCFPPKKQEKKRESLWQQQTNKQTNTQEQKRTNKHRRTKRSFRRKGRRQSVNWFGCSRIRDEQTHVETRQKDDGHVTREENVIYSS